MAKLALVDCETSGLSPLTDEIIEIACLTFDSETFEVYDTLNVKVIPLHPETGHPKAYEVNGYTPDDWKEAISLEAAMHQLSDITMDAVFMSYNYHFDLSFIEEALQKTDISLAIKRHKIDLLSIAFAKIPHHAVKSWSLKNICAGLDITPEPAVHRAINGVMCEYELYKALMA